MGGRTQQWLADEVGVTQAAVSYWMGDRRQPELNMARKIADTLGVEPGWLAFGSPNVGTIPCRICGVDIEWTSAYGWMHSGGRGTDCQAVATP